MITNLDEIQITSDQERVLLLIRQLGLKQYELAEMLGYNPVYFESVINGRAPFTKAFKVRINHFLETYQKENLMKWKRPV
ncbi:hypothetical protein [Cytobacillus purgationiresistens]|uniref:Plasmid maintenance system antidote protein VapI n=1 Tax=Cytobacillus purgationiresistens TaxID=863449 RepID=A0ABU0ATZ4_9BACI|nr:hypothetical protein [Cytobacillus purgationiresistens]MDQ0273500.1 plasmid maintenance system antidote protein VapI [Cytobacillus purgationiresistens]